MPRQILTLLKSLEWGADTLIEQLNTIKPWPEKGYVEFPLLWEDKEERYGAGTAGGSGEVE